jgi:hypothetical protein
MYQARPGLLIGFHGCDISQQQSLLKNPGIIPVSDKPYDWLGHGMYFWENNYDRAMEWAKVKEKRGKIKEAAVIGAVLDLSYCCDLQDSHLHPKYFFQAHPELAFKQRIGVAFAECR